jgi:transcriptional repressor NrdR
VPLHDLTVVKSTGEQEPFDQEKLFRSLKSALRKRPVDEDRIQRSANTIQRTLETNAAKKVATETIGQMALERLAELDKVAYVRFASVYKDFSKARDFEDLLGALKQQKH